MQIERVNIDNVYPVEDEYGNQYLSRDYTLKANKDYVTQLAASFGDDGEPNEPPVLVRDGGIYRIKAGNSRIMAMRELGTKSFNAIIDDKDTPQSLVEAAIRTDTKKTYEQIERSRFEQQLYLFADDEYVSKTTGRSVDEVKKVRRTMQNVEDAAEDMTIERMIVLSEFEDDDPDAYKAIAYASEKDWRKIAEDARAAKANKERKTSLFEALRVAGIPEVTDVSGLRYRKYLWCASDIPVEILEGSVYRLEGSSIVLYSPVTNEEAEKKQTDDLLAEYEEKFAAITELRTKWFCEHLSDDLNEIYELADAPDVFNYRINRFINDNELDIPRCQAEAIEAFVSYSVCRPYTGDYRSNPGDYMVFQDALKACGYVPCEDEVIFYELAKHTLEEGEE